MFALQLFLMIVVLGLFSTAGILVAYDVYMATRLRCLLQRNGHAPLNSQEIGEAAQAASHDHRPNPCGWLGSRRWKEECHEHKDKHRRACFFLSRDIPHPAPRPAPPGQ